jgi:hypothetical protein
MIRYEAADKNLLRVGFEFLISIVHLKEIRDSLNKRKLIDNCLTKLNKSKNT